MNSFKLALRFLKRDGRAGELTLLVLALVIAVANATTISLFADRLHRTLALQAAEFLAGDLVISGPAPIDDAWLEQADSLGLKRSRTTEFGSVLLENDQMLLASIKAVSQAYPLRGFLKIQDENEAGEVITGAGGRLGGEAHFIGLEIKFGRFPDRGGIAVACGANS